MHRKKTSAPYPQPSPPSLPFGSDFHSSTLAPAHKKNSFSVDVSPSATPTHHRRSNSDFHVPTAPLKPSPKETMRLPLPLLKEESSDMSESERVIRDIIQIKELNQSKATLKSTFATGELHAQVEKIKVEMQGEDSQKETKRRHLKQAILQLLAPKEDTLTQKLTDACSSVVSSATVHGPGSSFAPYSLASGVSAAFRNSPQDCSPPRSKRSSACSSPKTLSPEPKAQPLPLFVSSKSTNRKIVKNALTAICLAGESHRKQRDEVSLILDSMQGVNYFIIVFKGNLGRQEFAGLYGLDPKSGLLHKLYGVPGYPEVVRQAMVQNCYRYDSSAREFKLLPHNRLSHAVDAVAIIRPR